MGYITLTGNLAATPILREGEKGPYTYARVLVTDRVRGEDGSWSDGATVGYDLAVSGDQARQLVAAAEASGNIRITFSGAYRVTEYKGAQGVRLQYEVSVDEVGVSLRGQRVRVEKSTTDRVGDDTPF